MSTLQIIIKGKVQGVFFRASAKEKAQELYVTGWIKNTPSGEVEALVTGSDEQLKTFVEWCKKGPKRAAVSEVLVTKHSEKFFESFAVLR